MSHFAVREIVIKSILSGLPALQRGSQEQVRCISDLNLYLFIYIYRPFNFLSRLPSIEIQMSFSYCSENRQMKFMNLHFLCVRHICPTITCIGGFLQEKFSFVRTICQRYDTWEFFHILPCFR